MHHRSKSSRWMRDCPAEVTWASYTPKDISAVINYGEFGVTARGCATQSNTRTMCWLCQGQTVEWNPSSEHPQYQVLLVLPFQVLFSPQQVVWGTQGIKILFSPCLQCCLHSLSHCQIVLVGPCRERNHRHLRHGQSPRCNPGTKPANERQRCSQRPNIGHHSVVNIWWICCPPDVEVTFFLFLVMVKNFTEFKAEFQLSQSR